MKGRSFILSETQARDERLHSRQNVGGESWYAIQTRSRFEKVVHSDLLTHGMESYFPSQSEEHQWKDRRKSVDVPLFTGYLFARFSDSPGGRLRVLQSRGVVRILGTGNAIQPVPDAEIDSVRGLLRSGKPFLGCPFTRVGAWVRVRRGVLAGIEGRLVRIRNEARLVLSVDLLSQSVATEVDSRDVEPIEARASRR